MKSLKKKIPLKFKSPIAVFLRERSTLPFELVWWHMLRTYIEEGGKVTQEKRRKIYHKVHRVTLRYLESLFKDELSKFPEDYTPGIQPEDQKIWIFWWQGEEYAPDIVKRCIASIRRNATGRNICVIDSKNYQEYVSVPSHISEKLVSGTISFTHFSDYYRMALLATHGGIWIDASIYLKDHLPDEIYDMPLYTVKNLGEDITNVSNWEWTVGVIGGWKGNTLFCAVETLLSKYWENTAGLVDYFLFDYIIRLVVDRNADLQQELSRIPVNNASFMYLQNHLADCADLHEEDFYAQDTVLYKISWKSTYPLITSDGKETMYSRWLLNNALWQIS